MTALLIQTALLGDAVLSLAAARAAAACSGAPVLVVTRPATAPLFAHDPAFIPLPFDKRGADAGARGLLRAAGRLSDALADPARATALLVNAGLRGALLASAARVGRRVAFADTPAARLATSTTPRLPLRPHDELALVADALGALPAPPDPRLHLTEAEQDEAADRLAALPRPCVALVLGSARPTKRLPFDLAAALAARLAARGGALIVTGGPEDRDAARALARACRPAPLLDATGDPLRPLAALLAAADAVVAGDTGLAHVAQAVGTPAVVLYGPTPPDPFRLAADPRLAPRLSAGRTPRLPCQPCSASGPQRCPRLHLRCMEPAASTLDLLDDLARRAIRLKSFARLNLDFEVSKA